MALFQANKGLVSSHSFASSLPLVSLARNGFVPNHKGFVSSHKGFVSSHKGFVSSHRPYLQSPLHDPKDTCLSLSGRLLA